MGKAKLKKLKLNNNVQICVIMVHYSIVDEELIVFHISLFRADFTATVNTC